MKAPQLSEQDRRRKYAAIVFQVVCYGYLVTMFLIQMYMRSARNW